MSEYIAIIKYNAGNIGSVGNAMDRIGMPWLITDNPDEIRSAKKVIFPGVGEASTTMKYLQNSGLAELLPQLVQPLLGICLGMQLMCSSSEEGNTAGLGIFSEKVKRFRVTEKVPHMGWNSIETTENPIFASMPEPAWFYFVHSYYAEIGSSCIGTAQHGIEFSACLQKKNFFAVQFHPEKSGAIGEQLLRNFISL